MAFLIESDPAFPAATARSTRSAPPATDGNSGEAFARSLQQDSGTADSENPPTTSSDQTNAKEAYARSMRPGSSDTGSADETERENPVVLPFSALPSQQDVDTSPDGDETDGTGEIKLGANTDSRETRGETDPLLGTADLNGSEDDLALQTDTNSSGSTDQSIIAPGIENAELPAQAGSHSPADAAAEVTDAQDDAASQSGAQALLVQATSTSATGQTSSRNSASDLGVKAAPGSKDLPAGTSGFTPSPVAGQTTDLTEVAAESPDGAGEEHFSMADLSTAPSEGDPGTGHPGKSTQAAQSPDGSPQVPAPAFGALPSSQAPTQSAQAQVQMAPTHALVTAGPAETVKIITDAIASPDDTPDRITVQLDPPELGRVSIDFKFDANGLQHITVTGDSPEALRQLRLMHFELTQALERNGLSSQNMTFQQQQSGQQQSHASASGRMPDRAAAGADAPPLATANLTADSIRPARTASGGLDIRL